IVRPAEADGKTPVFASAKAKALAERSPEGADFVGVTLELPEINVPAGQKGQVALNVFLGPRQRTLLNSDYYGKFPKNYDETLVLTSVPCSVCTFPTLINFLVKMLGAFYF